MIIPIEKIWQKFKNKYKAVNIASLEARKLKEEQGKGLVDEKINPVLEAIRKLLAGKIKYTE
ncbi:MAG: DNA-directed RNA polymerase subunit omega [bacterium]